MKIKYKFFSPTVVILTLILLVVILFVADLYATRQKSINSPKVGNQIIKLPLTKPKNTVKDDDDDDDDKNNNNNNKSSCNLLSGRWVYDNTSEPEYKDTECSFMDEGMACEKFGRKNLDYKYWKWQPHDCDLPRFHALAMLEILRNKRLVYVGDSLNRNQWVSMVCMVESWIPQSLKYVHFNGSFVTFKAIAFNASIDFYWAPLLVESNCDNPTIHRVPERIVQVQAIEKHARHWHNADFIVFNSYIWWRWPKFKFFSDGVYQEVEMLAGYKMALKTWSDWLVIHVNRSKTKLFFVSSSPTHNRAEEWSLGANVNCYNETEPISKEGFWGIDSDPRMMRLVEAAIAELSQKGVKVQMLNITQISEYRKDAHSSIYRKQWDPLTQDQLANPSSYADCTHWCLPGVPDVWNQFLYTYLFSVMTT